MLIGWFLLSSFFVIDESESIQASLSSNSHNRISVEDGSVERVFGDGEIFSVNIDPTTGQAFVNVLKKIDGEKAMLTVVTGSGLVQDIEVSSCEGPSTHICLKEPEDPMLAPVGLSHAPTIELLNKIIEEKIPFGYGERTLSDQDALALPDPLIAYPLKAFDGPFETVIVYEMKNEGGSAIVLSADALKKGNSWVFFNVHELDQDGKALCIVGRSKEESNEKSL